MTKKPQTRTSKIISNRAAVAVAMKTKMKKKLPVNT